MVLLIDHITLYNALKADDKELCFEVTKVIISIFLLIFSLRMQLHCTMHTAPNLPTESNFFPSMLHIQRIDPPVYRDS